MSDTNNAAPKFKPPPPTSKPPPPPKPVKVIGGETVPIHEAIKRVTVDNERNQNYVHVESESPTSSNPFADEKNDEEVTVVNKANPLRDYMKANKPLTPKGQQDIDLESAPPLKISTTYNEKIQNGRDSNNINLSPPSATPSVSPLISSKETKRNSVHNRQNLGRGEPNNMIYHKIRMSITWLYVAILMHIGQWLLLLNVGYYALPPFVMGILVVMVVLTALLLVTARLLTKKSYLASRKNIRIKQEVCTPDDEKDDVPDRAVYCIAFAGILEGISFALYTAVAAGNASHLGSSGFYTQNVMLQCLRFTSISLLAVHRSIRPANRIDPMRTMLELEVVSVCWDALDGSTLYQLLENTALGASMDSAIRVLMAFWYLSVGVRMGLMIMTHLAPNSRGYKYVLMAPLQLAPQPTVDRTCQGLRLRAAVIMVMSAAEFYAIAIRVTLWARGQLDSLQQDMCIKNILFLSAFYGAYDMYQSTITREWNSRELGFGFRYPSRDAQLEYCRYGFIATYILTSGLLSSILIEIGPHSDPWVANIVLDCILALIFYFYCKNVHIQEATHGPSWCCIPAKWFIVFPAKLAFGINTAMVISLLGARIPALYYNYSGMAIEGSGDWWTYNNSMLIVILAIVPIGLCGQFWSIAYMLFRREFTACPGNYNAIHDPTISMVAMATITEGALDVLSCAQLMALAENNLPSHVNGAIVLFAILEVANACQCFALQCLLSGGHDDTPMDLVKWKAYLRMARGLIDLGTFILRVVLWVQYRAVSSVFLVKNAYNLIHASAQVERWNGVSFYPKGTLFSEFVPPADWYGMSKEQWKEATSHTIAAQARAGRAI